jgi:hypothetical protein
MITRPRKVEPPKKGRLTQKDHNLLREFLACVLDRYKGGATNRERAVSDIAHLVDAVDLPDGDDWNAYMRAIIESEEL